MCACFGYSFHFVSCVSPSAFSFQRQLQRDMFRWITVHLLVILQHMAVQTNVSCRPFVLRKYSAWHELVTSCCRCVVGAGTQWVVAKGPPINWPNICISHIGPCWLLSACRHTGCCSLMFICCATYTVWAAGVWHPCHQILKHYVNAETLFSLSRELLYRFLCSTGTNGE